MGCAMRVGTLGRGQDGVWLGWSLDEQGLELGVVLTRELARHDGLGLFEGFS